MAKSINKSSELLAELGDLPRDDDYISPELAKEKLRVLEEKYLDISREINSSRSAPERKKFNVTNSFLP